MPTSMSLSSLVSMVGRRASTLCQSSSSLYRDGDGDDGDGEGGGTDGDGEGDNGQPGFHPGHCLPASLKTGPHLRHLRLVHLKIV